MTDQYSGRFMSVSAGKSSERTLMGPGAWRWARRATILLVAFFILAPLVTGLMAWNGMVNGPLPEERPDVNKPTYVFLDENGREIGLRGPYRRPVNLETIPRHTLQAFLSIEDRRFFRHGGVDLIGIARAAHNNYEAGKIVEGGSTITQQLVKNLYLTSEQTIDRKLQEAIYAIRLESRRSKREILERYLYTVYFGSNAYGIEAAAETYFGKAAKDLTVAESAMLAGLIKAPSSYNPFRREELARERARLVLGAMKRDKAITPIQEQLALYDLEQIAFKQKPAEPNGYFLDLAAATAEAEGRDGYNKVRTTLDRPYQLIAENTIRSVMTDELKKEFNVHQAAMVVMRPTGEVIAIVGGTDYGNSQFNRAVSAQRQPGSLFKLFVYDAALKKGWRPDDYVVDVPISLPVPDKDNEWYKPANYDDRYYGLLSTKSAFAYSANSAALRLQEYAGREQVISHAREAGLDNTPDPWPSLALGVFESNLLDLTAGYASLVSNRRVDPVIMRAERTKPPVPAERMNEPLLQLMRESVKSGTSRTTAIATPSFGKTGTTQDYRDAWYIGMTDNLIVGVWVGNDDYTPMNKITGASLPGLLWKTFMEEAEAHLALEKNAPTFATKPLVEIIGERDDPEAQDDAETRQAELLPIRKRILGPARVNADASLHFYGRTYRLYGIDANAHQPYTLLAEKLPQIANRREMMCEIHSYTAKCEVNGRDLSSLVASSGWAAIASNAESDLWYAEQSARDAGKGIWSDTYRYRSWGTYAGSYDMTSGQGYGVSEPYQLDEPRQMRVVGQADADAAALAAEDTAARQADDAPTGSAGDVSTVAATAVVPVAPAPDGADG